ncbi:MAG TPA: PQQ-binding-like beta-propeller repeat protein, partial [Pyrinomonadaceae bacterium]|nr:PQQ-binding-like beta-propeller repeat protein [Pyrinomonadaceae bacterium]
MLSNTLPKIIVLTIICATLLATASSQPKPPAEVDITKCWVSPAPEGSGSGFVSDSSRLYAGGDGGRVEALSLDGKKMWATELGGDIRSNLLATDNGLFLVTVTVSPDATKSPLNQIISLSKETGITNWTGKLPDASGHNLNEYHGTVVIVSKSGVIQSIDAKTGAMKWKREIAEGFATEPRFFAEKLIVAST